MRFEAGKAGMTAKSKPLSKHSRLSDEDSNDELLQQFVSAQLSRSRLQRSLCKARSKHIHVTGSSHGHRWGMAWQLLFPSDLFSGDSLDPATGVQIGDECGFLRKLRC
jgi:hypothetical protein